MPAKTPARKSTRKKPAARKAATKHHNGVPPARKSAAEAEALRAEAGQLQAQIRESTERSAALEKELADARASGAKTAELEQALQETQARLTTQRAELEAARVESQNLREEVIKARSIPPPPRQGCPKCSGPMSDYQLDTVRARRCQACHGLFFESGELEKLIKHHDEQALAGKKGFFSGIFGKK
jgi:uncharacterized protein YhaN